MSTAVATACRWVVEVQQSKLADDARYTSRWESYRYCHDERITETPGWLGGTLVLVNCRSEAHAEDVMDGLTRDLGLPQALVRVRQLPVMAVHGGPGACTHRVTEYVSLDSRPAARCCGCGEVQRVVRAAGAVA